MKFLNLPFIFLLLLSSSCKRNDNTNNPPSSENTWKLENHTYKQNGPIQQAQEFYVTNNNPFSLIKATTVTPSDNGLFSGANITFNTHEAGIYSVKSQSTMISNLDAKYMYIEVIIGNLQNQGAAYGSTDGNITVKVEKIDGKFVITAADPITMSKLLDTGLNSPATSAFTCNKVK